MASYSKQMMVAAQTWLAANPDPYSTKLQIPQDPAQASPAMNDLIAQTRIALHKHAHDLKFQTEARALLEELRASEARRSDALRDAGRHVSADRDFVSKRLTSRRLPSTAPASVCQARDTCVAIA